MKFQVLDRLTNQRADAVQIALNEDWARGLFHYDMGGFVITEDGTLYLTDLSGGWRKCPKDRFILVCAGGEVDK